MTDESLSKIIVTTNKRFFLQKEFSILNAIENLPEESLISSGELADLGMLVKGTLLAPQVSAWDIPIKKAIKNNKPTDNLFGAKIFFERNAVIDRLGKSYLIPLTFLRECIDVPISPRVKLWAQDAGIDISYFGNCVYVIRAQAKRLLEKPVWIRGSDLMRKQFPDPKLTAPQPLALDLQSPPVVPDGDPVNHSHGVCLDHRHEPIIQTDNPVSPPQLPILDITPRGAPLVTTLDEVNLAMLKQIRHILERCESLIKDADHSYEVMTKQNQHIFKAIQKIDSNLETLLKEFA